MKNETMTRAKEIDLLQQLKGDTYFAEYFTNEEIDQMCENIKNDFSIDCNIGKMQKAENAALRNKIGDLNELINDQHKAIVKHEQEIEILKKATLNSIHNPDYSEEDYWTAVYEVITHEEVLEFKIENGLPLTDEERKAVLAALRK